MSSERFFEVISNPYTPMTQEEHFSFGKTMRSPLDRERKEFIPGENLFEKLASVEHQRWSDWQSYVHSICDENPNGSLTIPSFFVKQWKRQIATPYDRLEEKEKDSDRKQVERYMPLIRQSSGLI